MGLRRTGREAAVKILYAMEFSEGSEEKAEEDYWKTHKGSTKLKEYSLELVEGVNRLKDEIDRLISDSSKNWEFERIPQVDRNILRLAVYELMECKNVAVAVIINEAVEIAKSYSGQETASFVNGILGKIERELRDEKKNSIN